MKFLNYVQATPALTWTIVHNFGQKVIADTWVVVNGSQKKILPKRVTNVDDNTLMLEFSVARSGGARLVASPYSYESVGIVYSDIGLFSGSTSSGAVPTSQTLQTVSAPTMDDSFAIGSWNVADEFATNNGNLTGRAVEYYTAPSSDSSRTLAWSNGGSPVDSSVAGGAMLVGSTVTDNAFPAVNDSGEFSNPNGIFIEFKYYATSIDTSIIVGFSLGATFIQVVSGDQSGYPAVSGSHSIRVDASGFNGYTQSNGDLLAAVDPISGGSTSYTLDRYYSDQIDGRGKTIRAELTATSIKLIVNGVTVLQQTPRWPVKFFSSGVVDQRYTNNGATLGLFRSNTESQTTLDYVRAGAL